MAASVGSEESISLLCRSLSCPDARAIYCNATTRRARQTPLHLAAAKGHDGALRTLIGFGASPSKRNAAGQTPLYRAACAGAEAGVAVLLEAEPGIVDWQDEQGQGALHVAAEDGHFGCVKLLVELAGASRELRDREGRCPADVARTAEIRSFLS